MEAKNFLVHEECKTYKYIRGIEESHIKDKTKPKTPRLKVRTRRREFEGGTSSV